MVGAAVLWIPTILMSGYLATATGKLTVLVSIKEIAGKPATKYYKVSEYVLDQDNTGIESVISYSGKHNQYLDLDIYIAIPIIADLYDTLSSPSAFLSQHFLQQVSSKISDTERGKKWETFWEESFEKFDRDTIQFTYMERTGNNEKRDNLLIAARKCNLYQPGAPLIILKPINEPFDQRNGNKLFYIFLSFGIGLIVWFIMIIIPGLHEDKSERFESGGESSVKQQLTEAYKAVKPVKGFVATPVFVALNILVFIFMVFKGLGFTAFYSRDLIPLGAIYEPAIQQGQWWRLITGMFLHGGIMHLFMNMVSLYLAGMLVELFINTKRFILVYLLSGIVAGLVSLWWHDKPVVAVGASGAIFGLYGVLLAMIIFKLFDASFNKFLLILLACTAGYSLVMGFLSRGIDNSAHLGGLIAGFIAGIFLARMMKKQNKEAGNVM